MLPSRQHSVISSSVSSHIAAVMFEGLLLEKICHRLTVMPGRPSTHERPDDATMKRNHSCPVNFYYTGHFRDTRGPVRQEMLHEHARHMMLHHAGLASSLSTHTHQSIRWTSCIAIRILSKAKAPSCLSSLGMHATQYNPKTDARKMVVKIRASSATATANKANSLSFNVLAQ